jgi:hypothetical protein
VTTHVSILVLLVTLPLIVSLVVMVQLQEWPHLTVGVLMVTLKFIQTVLSVEVLVELVNLLPQVTVPHVSKDLI